MNKSKIVIGTLIFLLVLVPVFQVKASISVAFIYSTDPTSAESYKSLLTAQGMTVDLVPSSDAATWDYSGYGLIIIGSDTGSGSQWEPEAAVSAITGTSLIGKPILGLGEGGYSFFGKLGLNIGYPYGAHGSYNQIYVVDSGHQVFNSPTTISIPTDRIITLYTSTSQGVVIYFPSPIVGVTGIGRSVSSTTHYLIITESPPGKLYALWGFTGSPVSMTQTGKDLFVNIVLLLARHSPDALFTTSPVSPEVGETVTFDASGSSDTDGSISSYSWDFGDGNTAAASIATHAYTSAGDYTVTLKVTDNYGLTDTETKTITVTPHEIEPQAPSASFISSPSSPEVGETVTFDASGSSDPDGTIVDYEWNFGDGSTGTGETASHAYSSAGAYTVTLTVTDNDGLTATTTRTITVPPPGLKAPSASFTSSPPSPEVGETVTFDASGSSDPDGSIVSYDWDFGDGNTGAGMTATHSYASAGTYGVTLTVADNDDLTDTATKTITVKTTGPIEIDDEPPVANAGNDMTTKAGSKVTFSAAGSSDNVGIEIYEWNFGDGNTGTGITTSHTYETEGSYTVTLAVTDAAGNSNTVTIVITVEERAAAGFPYWIIIPIIIAVIVAAVVVWFFLKKRKPKEKAPKPVKLRITAEPTEILADGKTKSAITVELLDKEGKPVPALANTEIKLITTKGKIEQPVVKIQRGKELEKTLLVSPKEAGTATLSAKVEDLESTSITVTFMEKKRYCMHCGTKMAFSAKRCPECGKSPPAGVDTKTCKNCKAVIPVVAKFCAECGASQPKEE